MGWSVPGGECLPIRGPGGPAGRLWPEVAPDARSVVLDGEEQPTVVRSGPLWVYEGIAVYAFPSPWPVAPETADPRALPWPSPG